MEQNVQFFKRQVDFLRANLMCGNRSEIEDGLNHFRMMMEQFMGATEMVAFRVIVSGLLKPTDEEMQFLKINFNDPIEDIQIVPDETNRQWVGCMQYISDAFCYLSAALMFSNGSDEQIMIFVMLEHWVRYLQKETLPELEKVWNGTYETHNELAIPQRSRNVAGTSVIHLKYQLDRTMKFINDYTEGEGMIALFAFNLREQFVWDKEHPGEPMAVRLSKECSFLADALKDKNIPTMDALYRSYWPTAAF